MATDRLKIYNGTLLLCGETRLASLAENRDPRHLLDVVWGDGGVRYCLEQGQWRFAQRSVRVDYDPDFTPEFGFQRAFAKPTDWVATSGVFSDESMRQPLIHYADEAGFWYSDYDELYVRYISDHADFGGDFSLWPASFTEYVKAYFASKIIHRLPGSAERIERILGTDGTGRKNGILAAALLTARNKDAMAGPVTFPNRGTWAASRHRGRGGRSDGGSITNLIG